MANYARQVNKAGPVRNIERKTSNGQSDQYNCLQFHAFIIKGFFIFFMEARVYIVCLFCFCPHPMHETHIPVEHQWAALLPVAAILVDVGCCENEQKGEFVCSL